MRNSNGSPIISTNNVRGKHGKNPGYRPGDHWVTCDRCSATILASEARTTWDNLVVCPDDWEPRHPQDFVRAKEDRVAAKEPIRSEPTIVYTEVTFGDTEDTIPASTHTNSL